MSVPRSEFGVCEWFVFGDHARVERSLERLAAIGCRRLRTHLSWADYLRSDGAEWYDWLLARLGREVEVLPCLLYTPPSLAETGRANGPPRDLKALADFVDHAIDRYGHHFDTVELWNEPNNLLDWDWRTDPNWSKFARMIVMAGHWARRRGKRVVLGGPSRVDLDWLEVMGRHGVLDHVDVVGLHGFPGTWDTEACWWTDWTREVEAARETCGRYRADLDFWVTEAGYATWRRDETEQARRFLDVLAAPVDRVYWYSLHDFELETITQEGRRFDERHYHMGLYGARGRRKLLARLLEDGGPAHVARTLERQRRLSSVAGSGPVLVTGGAGFIGANLADRLCRDGHHVHVVDSLARPGVEDNLHWLQERHPSLLSVSLGDVRDTDAMADAGADAAAVFHLAAQVAVTTSLDDPGLDFEVNLQATFALLQALARRRAPPPFIFASTNKVYGELADLPLELVEGRWLPRDPLVRATGIDECRGLDFHTPYGCSKGAADQYVLDHARRFGLPAVVMRMSCVYGPHQCGNEDQGWVAHFLVRALDGEPITIFGDGRQVRDVVDVGDVVGAFVAAWNRIDTVAGEAFNLGGGPANAVSLLDVLDFAADATGSVLDVRHAAPRPGDQRWYVSDIRKARARLGLPAPRPWRRGVGALADWLHQRRGQTPAVRAAQAAEFGRCE